MASSKTPDGRTVLGIGKDLGPVIPAAPFFGEVGTLAFTLCYVEPEAANRMMNRHLFTLRMADRGFFGFYPRSPRLPYRR